MLNFEKHLDDIFESVKSNKTYKSNSMESIGSENISPEAFQKRAGTEMLLEDEHLNLPVGPQEEYALQRELRPFFNKRGINSSKIGVPSKIIGLDYNNGESLNNHYACTFFFDIKGSTRLSLLYPLEDVFYYKNTIIQMCIEVIRSLDGHVHRIMGDAVMAFFVGSSGGDKENAVADAINCAAVLKCMMDDSIVPWLEKKGYKPQDIGFRIGCDFGDNEQIIWGGFGYFGVGEISAAGLQVDMASKLQNQADINEVMLGQTLLDFINWPDFYSKYKTETINGIERDLDFLTPNLEDRLGKPIDYRMRQLNLDKYIEIISFPTSYRSGKSRGIIAHNHIQFKCEYKAGGEWLPLYSACEFLEKGIDLIFSVCVAKNSGLNFPLTAEFYKTNHGNDTPLNERGKRQYKGKRVISQSRNPMTGVVSREEINVSIEEATSFRGLHTMECRISDARGNPVFRDIIGVLIK